MPASPYSRKLRQLDQRIREWNLAVSSGVPKRKLTLLWKKICSLIKVLSASLPKQIIAHRLATILVSGGFTLSATAQNFAPPVSSPFGFEVDTTNYIGGICAADLDDDGDLDLIIGGFIGTFDYLENTGTPTAPIFDSVQTNPFGLSSTYVYSFMTAADLDNDGDLDIMAGQYYGNHVYYQNVGSATNPQFTLPVINPFGLSAGSYISMPDFADLDNDGDYDVISGEAGGLIYFENTGTENVPAFAPAQSNPFGLVPNPVYFSYPSFGDLDEDGDFDLIIGETNGNFRYMENTGDATIPSYNPGVLNPFGIVGGLLPVKFPEFADIDSDGDLDILVSAYEGELLFYENIGVAGLSDIESAVQVFPNPFNDFIKIEVPFTVSEVILFDAIGKEVYTELGPQETINLKGIESGMYTITIVDESGNRYSQKLVSN